jgi:hypothetical protein
VRTYIWEREDRARNFLHFRKSDANSLTRRGEEERKRGREEAKRITVVSGMRHEIPETPKK